MRVDTSYSWGTWLRRATKWWSENRKSVVVPLCLYPSDHSCNRYGPHKFRTVSQAYQVQRVRFECRGPLEAISIVLRINWILTQENQYAGPLFCRNIKSIVYLTQSATLVISYLMKKNKWNFKDTISEVRRHRPKVLPNLGFERQLKLYERRILSALDRGRISRTNESKKGSLTK